MDSRRSNGVTDVQLESRGGFLVFVTQFKSYGLETELTFCLFARLLACLCVCVFRSFIHSLILSSFLFFFFYLLMYWLIGDFSFHTQTPASRGCLENKTKQWRGMSSTAFFILAVAMPVDVFPPTLALTAYSWCNKQTTWVMGLKCIFVSLIRTKCISNNPNKFDDLLAKSAMVTVILMYFKCRFSYLRLYASVQSRYMLSVASVISDSTSTSLSNVSVISLLFKLYQLSKSSTPTTTAIIYFTSLWYCINYLSYQGHLHLPQPPLSGLFPSGIV